VEIELFVGGDAWLERLLLQLGPDARVVRPPEYRRLAADAAERILRRYRATGVS
jgi:predicted DNA-binding transcriptional regulator YafY